MQRFLYSPSRGANQKSRQNNGGFLISSIWGKRYRIHFMIITQQNNIILVIFDQSVNEKQKQVEQAEELIAEIKKIFANNPGKKFGLILDLSKPKLFLDTSSWEAVKIYEQIVNLEQMHRTSILAAPNVADYLIEVAFSMIAKDKVGWFSEHKKAEMWVKIGLNN